MDRTLDELLAQCSLIKTTDEKLNLFLGLSYKERGIVYANMGAFMNAFAGDVQYAWGNFYPDGTVSEGASCP
jgi:hypothetical protein